MVTSILVIPATKHIFAIRLIDQSDDICQLHCTRSETWSVLHPSSTLSLTKYWPARFLKLSPHPYLPETTPFTIARDANPTISHKNDAGKLYIGAKVITINVLKKRGSFAVGNFVSKYLY